MITSNQLATITKIHILQLRQSKRGKGREDTESYSSSLFRPRFGVCLLFLIENASIKDFNYC